MIRVLGVCLLVLASASAAYGNSWNGGFLNGGSGGNTNGAVVTVPEPGLTALLLAAGAYGLARARRRRD